MLYFVTELSLVRAPLSVLLAVWVPIAGQSARAQQAGAPILQFQRGAVDAPRQPEPVDTVIDAAVQSAAFDGAAATDAALPADPRQLAPQSQAVTAPQPKAPLPNNRGGQTPALPQIESLTTAAAGLAIVVGLFLLCMSLVRRSGPRPTSPLPRDAVAVLGRVPLAARNFAHLLQVGNKLVLVAITPDGVSPITEVTEPTEVQRLLGLCLRGSKHSTTVEFQKVMQQLAAEPAQGFLGNEAAAAYARTGK